ADIFEIDQASIVFNEKSSDDWAVFKIKKNKLSKKLPGEVYGYYPVNFTEPRAGEEIVISGYGRDLRGEGDFNFTLQTHQGPLIDTHTPYFGKALAYKVDTEGGNSGSAIIRVKEQDIIGIHTHGGCDSIENHGTAFFARLKLQEADR